MKKVHVTIKKTPYDKNSTIISTNCGGSGSGCQGSCGGGCGSTTGGGGPCGSSK